MMGHQRAGQTLEAALRPRSRYDQTCRCGLLDDVGDEDDFDDFDYVYDDYDEEFDDDFDNFDDGFDDDCANDQPVPN